MGLIIKDRRQTAGGKSTGNRQKFLKRVKGTIQSTGHNIINGGVGNTSTNSKVTVKRDTIDEPTFVYAGGGERTLVLSGNDQYIKGDVIDLPEGDGSGSGSGSGQGGDGEDDFAVEISRDEFLDFFFEDLELPNLEKVDDAEIIEFTNKNAGYVTDGAPSKLSVLESKKKAKLRKLALTSSSRKKLKMLELELDELLSSLDQLEGDKITPEIADLYEAKIKAVKEKMDKLNSKIKKIPGLEEIDLRYRSSTKVAKKVTSAVIFFIMDNSGSMGVEEKTLARKFFTLMYLFVRRKYGNADLVFISHTEVARELTEEEFFNTRESGGTMVSSALKLCSKIVKERYSNKSTNIFIVQASDGDNWSADSAICFKELAHEILPAVQHYTYIQVGEMGYTHDSQLWATYSLIAGHVSKFAAEKIRIADDIYPVFRSIFKKQGV